MTIGFDEIQLDITPVGRIVTLKFKQSLEKADYDEFVPQIETIMQKGDNIRLLVELHDFEGWTAGALWEDTKFAARHFNDIDRLAVVGDKQWENGVTVFVKPFTNAQIRFFSHEEIDAAQRWIRASD
jgi:hypothetical protein